MSSITANPAMLNAHSQAPFRGPLAPPLLPIYYPENAAAAAVSRVHGNPHSLLPPNSTAPSTIPMLGAVRGPVAPHPPLLGESIDITSSDDEAH